MVVRNLGLRRHRYIRTLIVCDGQTGEFVGQTVGLQRRQRGVRGAGRRPHQLNDAQQIGDERVGELGAILEEDAFEVGKVVMLLGQIDDEFGCADGK